LRRAPESITFATASATPRAGDMEASALVTFMVVAGIVWGGFLLIASTAIRKERVKRLDV